MQQSLQVQMFSLMLQVKAENCWETFRNLSYLAEAYLTIKKSKDDAHDLQRHWSEAPHLP